MGAVVRCANCRQSWLAPGLRPGETHVCKGCGQRLLVGGRAERAPRRGARGPAPPPSAPLRPRDG
jgi:DNA-directed RNA polymerase subunit RPC12/RpoP